MSFTPLRKIRNIKLPIGEERRLLALTTEFYRDISKGLNVDEKDIRQLIDFKKVANTVTEEAEKYPELDMFFTYDRNEKPAEIKEGLINAIFNTKDRYNFLIEQGMAFFKHELNKLKDENKEEFTLVKEQAQPVVPFQHEKPLSLFKHDYIQFQSIPEILANIKAYNKAEKELKKYDVEYQKKQQKKKFNLDNKRKYKIMAKQSNQLAKEIQKTIERVAAQGFGEGEIQYAGRGYKKPVKRKVPKSKPMKKKKAGRMHYEDPAEEVAYILEKLSEMIHHGDVHHIDLVAKNLRKAKKIGKGKYYVMDEHIYEHGAGYPTGGARKKVHKPKKMAGGTRVMSPKQKAWLKFVKKVHKENPELSYKDAMKLASQQRHEM